MKKFDLAIIGAGPGGMDAALHAASLGIKTALIEKNLLGGTCLNVGCIPTKSLLASTRLLSKIRNANQYGIAASKVPIDFKKMTERKNEIVNRIRSAAQASIQKSGVEWIEGEAAFQQAGRIEVSGKNPEIIEAKNMIIATGSTPSALPGIPFGKHVLSSNEILELDRLPKNLLIVGGGAVGVEFASIFHALDVEVTVIEMLDRLLPSEDPDCASRLENLFTRRGIRVLTGTRLEEREVKKYEKILVAVGRRPNVENLGLEKTEITKNQNQTLRVNEFLETDEKGVFAIGDVIASPQLAHVASFEGIRVVENLRGPKIPVDYRVIPSCVYSDPEVASIGLTGSSTTSELQNEIIQVRIPFSAVAKAQIEGETEGFFKLFATKDGKIAGASGIGAHVTELVAEIGLAIHSGLTVRDLTGTLHAHPTEAEVISMAARELAKRLKIRAHPTSDGSF